MYNVVSHLYLTLTPLLVRLQTALAHPTISLGSRWRIGNRHRQSLPAQSDPLLANVVGVVRRNGAPDSLLAGAPGPSKETEPSAFFRR